MARPPLTASLTASEFAAWYWLKEELVAFCRQHRLSPTGTKPDVATRIHRFLGGEAEVSAAPPARRQAHMPGHFTLDTVIEDGWRCGPALGTFLRQHLGGGFHFNAAMRDFIHNGSGKTLAAAVLCYRNSIRIESHKRAIPHQLEYLRHLRQYFLEYPGASRAEAIAAWWDKRAQRNDRTVS